MPLDSSPVIRHTSLPLDGLLIVDKPAGWTSHDVVARVRRLTGIRRVGHAGTLDPMATGVLPVAIGLGTRVMEYLLGADKAYRATVHLGVTTDTDDAEGRILRERDWRHVTEPQVRDALAAAVGEFEQVPPTYSAVKRGGVPLYKLARAGTAVAAEPRRVLIYSIAVKRVELPEVSFDVRCSKGTYIRSLARDLGEALGCGAHLARLVRVRAGPFNLSHSHSLDAVAAAAESGGLAALVLPPDAVLLTVPALVLDSEQERRLLTGRDVRSGAAVYPAGTVGRAYGADGAFLGIVRAHEDGAWRPEKVLVATA